ncbi:IS200/IS605 family accessory protein TnpB-related protein [Pararhizobium sp. BT-229]|uniref:IS200/IS605 family accessory protein TnpB-related protein n=1 Tax=Pararhizobium sp. BT-229 TaxID=2986923 RepID=UPI0021F72504|nr:IS200/IS605 family accessory protein TnpB-related protein [Pararhizobium sp. BT-229]MCV9963674.1 IS200/IS605 family accessory protein TnpB-related protein [Pararhizobium sp. BT-229]
MAKRSDEKGKDRHVRTIVLTAPSRDWERAARALTHEAKNLYNTVTFLVRQINSAYRREETGVYVRAEELHPNQTEVIAAFNAMIGTINAKRSKKEDAKVLPLLEERMAVSPLSLALDVTLLDNVARVWADGDGDVVYRRLPASSAQQVVRSVIDVWKASLSAMKDWGRNPAKYTGRPQLPSFKDKDGNFPLEIPYSLMIKGFPKPKTLPVLESLGDASLELLDRFYSHDLRAAVAAACAKRGWDEFRPQHLRIVEKAGRIRIEAVVALAQSYPEGSFLKRMFDAHGEVMRSHKTADQRDRFILAELKALKPGDDLHVAGIDVGEKNIAAVAFSTGHRAMVHSGERPTAIVEKYNALLDALKAKLASPRMKELQRLKAELEERNERLDKARSIELRKEQGRVFRDPLHRNLLSRLDRIRSDLEHKITTDIVGRCATNGVGVIVVGRNKGMKSEKDWGTKRNRESRFFAHARFLALLRYKAEGHGIAVVTVEESYTSKASFVDHDELRVYGDTKHGNAVEDGASGDQSPAVAYSGKRSASNRNWFIRHNAGSGRLSRVHADVNGAFNIIRKALSNFRHHAGLSLKFNVRRISPASVRSRPCPASQDRGKFRPWTAKADWRPGRKYLQPENCETSPLGRSPTGVVCCGSRPRSGHPGWRSIRSPESPRPDRVRGSAWRYPNVLLQS